MQESPPKVGDTLGRFRLTVPLGEGRAGFVFMADDTLVKQPVAIKILRQHIIAHAGVVDRVHRDVAAARRVNHRGIRALYDVHEAAGRCMVTMQYVDGVPLAHLFARVPRPSPVRLLGWAREIADALDAAHKLGVVHGALTARDVMIRQDTTACVLDLGVTCALLTVARGNAPKPADDVRAVAALIFEGLTGTPLPLPGTPPPLLSVLRPDLSPKLDALIARATAERAGARTPSLEQLSTEIGALLGALGVAQPAAPVPLPTRPLPPGTVPRPVAPPSDASAPTVVRGSFPQPRPVAPPGAPGAAHTWRAGPPTNPGPQVSSPGMRSPVARGPASDPLGDDATLALPSLAAPPNSGLNDDSASWVIGGRAIDLPALAKEMQAEPSTSGTEPVHRTKKPVGRKTIAAGVFLLIVGMGAGVAWFWLRAQAPADATDAGPASAVERDAGPGGPATDAQGAADGGTPVAAAPLDALLGEAKAAMAARGVILEDDIEVDRLFDRLTRAADTEDATDALTSLKSRLEAVPIDKRLVTRKLGRLRVEVHALPAARQRSFDKLLEKAAGMLQEGRAVDANAVLNEASAALRGAP